MATLSSPRNAATTRITHWLTALSFVALFGSGAAIYNHRPRFRFGTHTLVLPHIPSFLSIGVFSKQLHYVFAALFVACGIIFVTWGLRSGHFRSMSPRGGDVRDALAMAAYYLRLTKSPPRHVRYNPLQKFAYAGVLFVVAPLIVLTGAAMLPIAAFDPLGALFPGGVKFWHFALIGALSAFVAGHLVMVVATGLRANLRTML